MNPEQGKMFLNFFVGCIEQEMETTRKVIAAVPDDKKNYRPAEKSMTAHELAWHIPEADVWIVKSVADGEFVMPDHTAPSQKPGTIADILKWYETNLKEQVARLKALPADKLVKVISFFGMELPAVMYLSMMTHHSVHHRGQLSAYLRPMGGKVPSIYGGSADEPFQAPA
jgi:uncharacterized damage-inducible protein DinB